MGRKKQETSDRSQPEKVKFGRWLYKKISKHGTMSEFAQFTGRPVSTVQSWCLGVNSPSAETLERLSIELSAWSQEKVTVQALINKLPRREIRRLKKAVKDFVRLPSGQN